MEMGVPLVHAWALPWDYALRLLRARDDRVRRANSADLKPMSNGKKHAPGVSSLLKMLGK